MTRRKKKPLCKKIRYATRRDARDAKRRMVGANAVGLRPYKCLEPQCFDSWHLGHLPEVIRHGDMTRREVYGEG